MKKTCSTITFLVSTILFSQFKVVTTIPDFLSDSEAYLYGFNGSKDILYSKATISNNIATFVVDKQYSGMMRAFFKKVNSSVNMVSENKNIGFKIDLDTKNKISNVSFSDNANKLFANEAELQKKEELILPALIQIKDYYKPSDRFYDSLSEEIKSLSHNQTSNLENYPFLDFYTKNQKFSVYEKANGLKSVDFINFFSKSGQYLETSNILKPSLINFLNISKDNLEESVNNLLNTVNLESQRGQIILSELIEIFNTYKMDKLKDKYLKEAGNLKCSVNERLASVLKADKNTELGSKMPNSNFVNAIHTKENSLYDVKASKKIIVFWSSTCSFCETELTKLLEVYDTLKSKNIEIVGFSLDSNLESYKAKATLFPWINDSEGKGWYSSYADTYNISATPTFFILDSDNKIINKPNQVSDILDYLKLK